MKVSLQNQYPTESLQRFQQARKLAQQKMEGIDPRQNLIEIIKKKQGKAGTGFQVSDGIMGKEDGAVAQNIGLSQVVNQTLYKANELLLYSSDSKNAYLFLSMIAEYTYN